MMKKISIFILSIMTILLIAGFCVQELEIDRGIQPNSGSYTLSKVIDSYTLPDQFVGYSSSTPDWSYASGYTLHTGIRCSFPIAMEAKANDYMWNTNNITYEWQNKARMHRMNFIADPSRASRLAVKSNVRVDKVQYTQYLHGKVVKNWTETRKTLTGRRTIYVKYR